jgi:peroxiredoxin
MQPDRITSHLTAEEVMDTAQPEDTQPRTDSRPPPGASSATLLGVGQIAPDFALRTTPDQRVSLSAFAGRPIVLVFYPADWSPVCGDQLALYNELHDEWQRHRAQLLGISVDNTWCHIAYARDRRLRFPLLSDFEPKGEVARRYGAYDYDAGTATRALFVLDRDRTIAWSYAAPVGVNPGADGILQALDDLAARREQAHA